jgi:hypothetical protein
VVERQVLGPCAPGRAFGAGRGEASALSLPGVPGGARGGPRGLLRGRWYGAGAIGQALALYARGATSALMRAGTSRSWVVGGSATRVRDRFEHHEAAERGSRRSRLPVCPALHRC